MAAVADRPAAVIATSERLRRFRGGSIHPRPRSGSDCDFRKAEAGSSGWRNAKNGAAAVIATSERLRRGDSYGDGERT